MKQRVFRTGRYANVTATMALIVALGGTSYAAVTLPKNSVGSRQIKKRAVTNSKLRASSVTSAKVKNGSLLNKDFKAGQIPPGPAGATKIVRRVAVSKFVPAGQLGAVQMFCSPGEHVIGGGLQGDALPPDVENIFTMADSFPLTVPGNDTPIGWFVKARNTIGNQSNAFRAFIVCAQP